MAERAGFALYSCVRRHGWRILYRGACVRPDGATATTQLSFTVFSDSNPRPFLQVLSCKLTKRDGRWVLDSCEQGFIT